MQTDTQTGKAAINGTNQRQSIGDSADSALLPTFQNFSLEALLEEFTKTRVYPHYPHFLNSSVVTL
jgi:hypothetical protein